MIEEFPNLNDDPKEENEKLPNNEEVENFSDNSEEYNSDIIELDYEELSKTVSEIASVGDNDDVFKEIEENQKKRKKKNTKEEIEEETKSLYAEFNEFLETKLDIKSEAEQKILIPTKLDLLDAILGGGFSAGTMAIITGSPGSFKSTLLAQVIASAQAIYAEKLLAAYMDSEEACSMTRLANLGVRNPTIKPKVNITVEKVFKLIEGMCRFKEYKKIKDIPSIVVWDSIANTLSEKEFEAEDINTVIGYKAKLLSTLIPKYIQKCSEYGICFLAVNQLRDRMSMGRFAPRADLKFMSNSKDMPGGTSLKFNAFHLLEMNLKSVTEVEKFGIAGVIVEVKCVKNKLFPPNVKIELVGDFVRGFSNFWSNYHFLNETKRLQSGAWNYLKNLPDKKFRTVNAPELYSTDPVFKDAFDELVKEAIKTDIIEKYNPPVM